MRETLCLGLLKGDTLQRVCVCGSDLQNGSLATLLMCNQPSPEAVHLLVSNSLEQQHTLPAAFPSLSSFQSYLVGHCATRESVLTESPPMLFLRGLEGRDGSPEQQLAGVCKETEGLHFRSVTSRTGHISGCKS